MTNPATDLEALGRRRFRMGLALTGVVTAMYVGFVLLVAFDKALLARLVAPGLSVGILLGALVILAAWLLTGFYARWANGLDAEVARLRDGREG